ncbi:MAG: DNA alkylation repair protein [Saprospiraceae bacterium]|nr:DNA alkylation repair protein [Saprospiraceae bacterium]
MKKTFTPEITPEQYLRLISDRFVKAGDPLRAEQQSAYMKHKFEFYGLGAPQWMSMAKDIFATHGMYTRKQLGQFVRLCYEQEYREIQYVGLDMMQRMLSLQNKSWIRVLEKCITTNAWWDSVDWLAKLVGMHFKRFPELQHTYAYKWIASDHVWLQRVAIIHQLMYKEATDEKLLFDMITRVADSKEFFLRKACGWALRQHAKVYPAHVRLFLKKRSLSGLTVREAMK